MNVKATALVQGEGSSAPGPVQALQQATFYAEQAEITRASAGAAVHAGVRDAMLRVAALWDLMAERCLVVEALRVASGAR
jgi:hypothetical protein